jgi:CheY-like chemotaxis protein
MPIAGKSGARPFVILLVEDEALLRGLIATCLRDAGYVVVETASGEDAIAQCRNGVAIDLVFSDVNLAGSASGWDVAKCFRMERPQVKVILTSGQDTGRRLPGSIFIPKPYLDSDIVSVCERLCK